MLQYTIQIILFQLAFLLVYEVWLRKETFFNYNRGYLLITPVLAIILPFLKFGFFQNAIPAETLVMLPEVILGGGAKTISPFFPSEIIGTGNQISWWVIIYVFGLVASLSIFLVKFRSILRLFKFKVISDRNTVKIVEVPDSYVACTFYNTIFLGDKICDTEREQIVSHEMIHVQQRHTLDLLFFEFLKIILWFNPLIYIYQSRISNLHEFIADAGVVEKVEKQLYFQQLLNSAFNTQNISFINQFFNHSIIKKRIVMLQKNKSKSVLKFKFLIILPLMLAMLTYVSCSSTQSQNTEIVNQETPPPPPAPPKVKTDTQKELDPDLAIPFAVVEQVPIFPGCEDLSTNKEQKDCMSQYINNHVNTNFDTTIGKELGLAGINRIYVRFKVSATGEVVEVESRAAHPDLGIEAERVVGDLPDMEPAIHRGKEVAILYSLPIIFQVAQPVTSEEEKEGDQN